MDTCDYCESSFCDCGAFCSTACDCCAECAGCVCNGAYDDRDNAASWVTPGAVWTSETRCACWTDGDTLHVNAACKFHNRKVTPSA